jgi:ribosomal protein L37E
MAKFHMEILQFSGRFALETTDDGVVLETSSGTGYMLQDLDGRRSITCLRCHRTSYTPADVDERYCGHCKVFHEDRPRAAARLEPAYARDVDIARRRRRTKR